MMKALFSEEAERILATIQSPEARDELLIILWISTI